MNVPTTLDADRGHRALRLLAEVGLSAPLAWVPLAGGANNQVFRLDLPERSVVLKAYFVHPDDPRDRLRADFEFSRFAWEHGPCVVAEPLAADVPGRLALFAHVGACHRHCVPWHGQSTRRSGRLQL